MQLRVTRNQAPAAGDKCARGGVALSQERQFAVFAHILPRQVRNGAERAAESLVAFRLAQHFLRTPHEQRGYT